MPRARYFLYVGGVLLALLFIADSYLPKLPNTEKADSHLPTIRLHSDQKWPERVVYDTRLPPLIPAPIANTQAGPAMAGSAEARKFEAFAQLKPSYSGQLQPSNPEKRELKQQRQRKTARKHATPRTRLVWRQPQLGWVAYGTW
jgi:hypothetical protein